MRATPAPRAALVAGAAAAAVVLGLVVLAAHVRTSVLLQRTRDGRLEAFIPEAERQLKMLKQEMPGGRTAVSFAREERELTDMYARTEKGLAKIGAEVSGKDEAARTAPVRRAPGAKLAPVQALAQRPASREDIAAIVDKAGSTMYMLEHQLPAADRQRFPKEARELQQDFSRELTVLSRIRAQIKGDKDAKKARRTSLRSQQHVLPGMKAKSSARLDQEKKEDDQENHKVASMDDLDAFFSGVNDQHTAAPAASTTARHKTANKAKHMSMLARAEAEDSSDQSVTNKRGDTQKVVLSVKQQMDPFKQHSLKGKGPKKPQQKKVPAFGRSSQPKWGSVLDPTLAWPKGPVASALTGDV